MSTRLPEKFTDEWWDLRARAGRDVGFDSGGNCKHLNPGVCTPCSGARSEAMQRLAT